MFTLGLNTDLCEKQSMKIHKVKQQRLQLRKVAGAIATKRKILIQNLFQAVTK